MTQQERVLLSILCANAMAETVRNDPDMDQAACGAEMMVQGLHLLTGISAVAARAELSELFDARCREALRTVPAAGVA